MSVIADKTLFLKQSLQVPYIKHSLKVQFDTDVILPEVKYKNYEKVAFTADLAWPNQPNVFYKTRFGEKTNKFGKKKYWEPCNRNLLFVQKIASCMRFPEITFSWPNETEDRQHTQKFQ